MIAVEGELRNNNYQDRNHPDVTHYNTEVLVDNVEFTGGKNDSGGGNNSAPAQQPTYAQQPQQNAPYPQNNEAMSYGSLSDFEEILSDGDVPF